MKSTEERVQSILRKTEAAENRRHDRQRVFRILTAALPAAAAVLIFVLPMLLSQADRDKTGLDVTTQETVVAMQEGGVDEGFGTDAFVTAAAVPTDAGLTVPAVATESSGFGLAWGMLQLSDTEERNADGVTLHKVVYANEDNSRSISLFFSDDSSLLAAMRPDGAPSAVSLGSIPAEVWDTGSLQYTFQFSCESTHYSSESVGLSLEEVTAFLAAYLMIA